MTGWRARLGFLVPPGNPTVEPEMYTMAPRGVSVHFSRLVARGATGTPSGLDDRTRSYLENIDSSAELLAMARPDVIVLAYTAGSYTLGRDGEAALSQRLAKQCGCPFITAFGSVIAALAELGVNRVALGTPYNAQTTLQGKAALESHGLQVVRHGSLPDVTNIYDETPRRAYWLGRSVDSPDAEAVFLSGTGMPTIDVLDALEQDLQKPVISAASAMLWNALRMAGVAAAVPGYGRLLAVPDR